MTALRHLSPPRNRSRNQTACSGHVRELRLYGTWTLERNSKYLGRRLIPMALLVDLTCGHFWSMPWDAAQHTDMRIATVTEAQLASLKHIRP